jgi:hypothetical protein
METQGMKQPYKVIKCVVKYEKCVFRYEIEFSWKYSGFSYLCGSISYFFGYEKNRCFFLMHKLLYFPPLDLTYRLETRYQTCVLLLSDCYRLST